MASLALSGSVMGVMLNLRRNFPILGGTLLVCSSNHLGHTHFVSYRNSDGSVGQPRSPHVPARSSTTSYRPTTSRSSHRYTISSPSPSYTGPRSTSTRDEEDEDLQLALRLSLAESAQEGRGAGYVRPGYQVNYVTQASEPPIEARQAPEGAGKEEDDPELAAAIAASLRELEAPKPSAPGAIDEAKSLPVLPTANSSVRLCPWLFSECLSLIRCTSFDRLMNCRPPTGTLY
jgi:hypothetical protein